MNSLDKDSKEIAREILKENSKEIQTINKKLDKELKIKNKRNKRKKLFSN